MISKSLDRAPGPSGRRIGTAFILLSLFAGLLGGSMASPFFHLHPSPELRLFHGLLMTFFVVCPAALGGLGQWFLPPALGARRTALPQASLAGFVFLAGGVAFLPLMPLTGLLLWALGMVAVATDVIATVFEQRTCSFSQMPPLAWSFFAAAGGVVLTAPVLAAFVTRALWFGQMTSLEDHLIDLLGVPETALMLTPALGIVVSILVPAEALNGVTHRVAPYVFAVIAVCGPLYWADTLFGGIPAHRLWIAVPVTQIGPCVVLVLALCRDAWARPLVLDAVTPWGFFALLMFGGGWASLSLGHGVAHSAAAFGSVMALCGGFYRWLCARHGARRFRRIGQCHAFVTVSGAALSLAPVTAMAGGALMGISLFGFGALGMVMLHDAVRISVRKRVTSGVGA